MFTFTNYLLQKILNDSITYKNRRLVELKENIKLHL